MRRVVVVSILIGAGGLSGDEGRCPETDTPRQCLRRFLPAQGAAVEAAVAAANSGAASPRVPSAVKDFLSIASAYAGAAFVDEQGESLAAAWNVPESLLGSRWQVQLEAEVSNDQDLRPALAFGPVTRRFGRRLEPHREAFEAVLLALLAPQTGEELGGIAWTGFDVPFDRIVEDAATRAEVIEMFALTARSPLPADVARFASAFATLLQNQPQLYASGSFHDRRDGGPRVWQATVTWELGTRNLNGFHAGEGKECAGRDCVDALARYLEQTWDPGRLALSLAYKRVDANSPGLVYTAVYGRTLPSMLRGKEGRIDVALSYDGTDFTSEAEQALLALTSTPRSVPPSYDRFVVSSTYTQKLSNRISLPLSIVWSERSESEPGECRTPIVSPPIEFCEPPVTTTRNKWVVHVGFTYKFPRRVPEWRRTQGCFCPEDNRRE